MDESPFGEALAHQSVWESTYTFTISEAGVRILRCESAERRITVPSMLAGIAVVGIEPWAFAGLSRCEVLVCPPHVRSVGSAAFAECKSLRQIVLPEDVESFDPGWFAHDAQLEDLVLPAHAPEIDLRACSDFYPVRLFVGAGTRVLHLPTQWKGALREIAVAADNPWMQTDGVGLYREEGTLLASCVLDVESYAIRPGCERVASEAFAGCHRLKRVELPSSVSSVGLHAFSGTALARDGFWRGGLTFSGGDARIVCTSEGLLLEHAQTRVPADGRTNETVVECIDESVRAAMVPAGVSDIGPRAFSSCGELVRVSLPDGLLVIGEAAFAGCTSLQEAALPATLVDIGAEAFAGTALTRVHIPAAVRSIGAGAFPASGARIEVSADNPLFAVEEGLLVQRCSQGTRVLRFAGACGCAVIPSDATVIDPRAFYGAADIDKLVVMAEGARIGANAFDFRTPPAIVVLEGESANPLVLRIPRDSYGLAGTRRAFGGKAVDTAAAVRACDEMIPYSDAVLERSRYELDRLADGRFLTAENRQRMEKGLAEAALDACAAFAEQDDSLALQELVEQGFLEGDKITRAIDRVQASGNVPMTALLLELKRTHGGMEEDYSL